MCFRHIPSSPLTIIPTQQVFWRYQSYSIQRYSDLRRIKKAPEFLHHWLAFSLFASLTAFLLLAMARKSSSVNRGRSTIVKKRSKSKSEACHAYFFPKEEFVVGKNVDGRMARSLFDLALSFKDEIIRHGRMDIRRCCNGLVSKHRILMAVNSRKPHSFGMLFNMVCFVLIVVKSSLTKHSI